jgi:hypothetical protein
VTPSEAPPGGWDAEAPLEVRLAETGAALARWQATLAERCPGEHQYVRHRADKPPMCSACGFLDNGLHRSDYGSGY